MITADRLREVLHYDPETGVFTWRVSRGSQAAGTIAGTEADGYINIQVDGDIIRAHRLAWLYVTGELPDHEVDHHDLNRSNNAWRNLRAATRSQNKHNVKAYSNNRSGYKGISFYKARGNWIAQIMVSGKRRFLGYFNSAEAAADAYAKAANDLHGDFARTA